MPQLLNTRTALLLSDYCGLTVSFFLAWLARGVPDGEHTFLLSQLARLAAEALFFLPLYAALRLYAVPADLPSEELKNFTLGTSIGFLFLGLLIFLGKHADEYSRFIFLFSWVLALVSVPLARYCTRKIFSKKHWWGYPVILFAPQKKIAEAVENIAQHQEQGLYVAGVVYLEPDPSFSFTRIDPSALSSAGAEPTLHEIKRSYPEAHRVLVLAKNLPLKAQHSLALLINKHFSRVIMQAGPSWLMRSPLCVVNSPCGQALAWRENLLASSNMRLKRALDIVFCLLGGIMLAFLIPIIALCIRLDSKGAIFFRQARIGQHGKTIHIYKFRTMVSNAEEVLHKMLAEHPELQREWRENRKLVNDPRLTRVGAFLRRTSLDELPQIFNVIKGEMSLVGPRPIVEAEIARYGNDFDLYCRVRPGITGLWQISGRNDTSYRQRVRIDQTYVSNWSIWLDIYIILHTFPALFSLRGAY